MRWNLIRYVVNASIEDGGQVVGQLTDRELAAVIGSLKSKMDVLMQCINSRDLRQIEEVVEVAIVQISGYVS